MSLPELDDEMLVRYLLSMLPEDAIERIEEAAIVDDDLASRLRLVEDDLLDSYVNQTLQRDTLKRFEMIYGSTARRRTKTRFAKDFVTLISPAPPLPSRKDLAPPSPTSMGVSCDTHHRTDSHDPLHSPPPLVADRIGPDRFDRRRPRRADDRRDDR